MILFVRHKPHQNKGKYMKKVSEISTANTQKDLDFICSEWLVSSDDHDMRQALIATIIKRLAWGASK